MDEVDWDTTVFALLAPDAIARHLGHDILARMRAAGFIPVAYKPLWRRPEALDFFNERNIQQVWRVYLYRLVDRLFTYGPSVALLLRDDAPLAGLNSHDRMRAVKGASQPELAKAGTIRGDLSSTNIMLALMHSSDTPDESRAESAVFTDGGFTDGPVDDLDRVVDLLQAGVPREDRDFDAVLAGVRARVIGASWADLPPPARDFALGLLAGGVADLAAPGAGAKLADLLGRPDHPLDVVLRNDFAADQPPDVDASPVLSVDHVRALLRTYGTDLDRWEDIVLATSLRFPPRRR